MIFQKLLICILAMTLHPQGNAGFMKPSPGSFNQEALEKIEQNEQTLRSAAQSCDLKTATDFTGKGGNVNSRNRYRECAKLDRKYESTGTPATVSGMTTIYLASGWGTFLDPWFTAMMPNAEIIVG